MALRAAVAARNRKAEGLRALKAPVRRDRMPATNTVQRPLCEVQAMSHGVRRRLGGQQQAPGPSATPAPPTTGGSRAARAPHVRATGGLQVRGGTLAQAAATPVHGETPVLTPGSAPPVRAAPKGVIRAPQIATEGVTAARRAPLAGAGMRQPASMVAHVAAVPSARQATAPMAVTAPRPAPTLAEAAPQALMSAIDVAAIALAEAAAAGSRRTTSPPEARGPLGALRSRFRPTPIRSCSIPRFAPNCAPSANWPPSSSARTW